MAALTLYFDGACHFCRREMARLARWDKAGRLAFIDIALPGFDPAPLGVTLAAMNTLLHAQRPDGGMLVGTDAVFEAYTVTGRPWLVWPLRVPLLRGPLAAAYAAFARNRYRISRWLGLGDEGTASCDSGTCNIHFGEHHGT